MTSPPETPSPSPRRRVLFLCTGNSARSQMAEALVNHALGDRWEAHSAGTAPAGYVHPLAIQVLGEIGVPLASLRSKAVEEFRGQRFDLVITLCDEAAERCPAWPGGALTMHMSFPDPSRAPGSPAARLAAFRHIRDAIGETLLPVVREGSRWFDEEPAAGVAPPGGRA